MSFFLAVRVMVCAIRCESYPESDGNPKEIRHSTKVFANIFYLLTYLKCRDNFAAMSEAVIQKNQQKIMKKTDQYLRAGNNPKNKTQTMKPTMKKCLLSVTAVIGLACLTSSPAATVIWGAAQNITGDSNVATNGTFNRAYIFGNIPWTVNGVTFGSFTGNVSGDTMSFPNQDPGFGDGVGGSPYRALSTEYQNLLYYGAWVYPSATASFTLNNLTIGYTYQVQIFANDSRTEGYGRSMALTGSSTVLDYNTTEAVGGVGQFAIGTFTANSTSQVLGFSSSTDTPQLNGLSLRVTAVPEPSTWAMLSLGLMSILFLRCRRHS